MNDEYLWNKTGEDPEIKRLEETLAVFRCRETAPPALPVAITAAEKVPRWRFTLALALASCAAVVIAAAVWFQISNRTNISENDVTFVALPEPETAAPAAPEPKTLPVQTGEPAKRPVRHSPAKIRPTTAATYRRPKTRTTAPKETYAALTKEEKYAYEQLMLALSITGSKLKIVQNTIDGTDDTENNAKQNNR